MNNRIFEALENILICQALELIIEQAENSGIDTPEHTAMLTFFESVLAKYRRKSGQVRLKVDRNNQIKIIDETLRNFNNN